MVNQWGQIGACADKFAQPGQRRPVDPALAAGRPVSTDTKPGRAARSLHGRQWRSAAASSLSPFGKETLGIDTSSG